MQSKDTTPIYPEQVSGPGYPVKIDSEQEDLLKYHIQLYFTNRYISDTALIKKLLVKYLAGDTGITLTFEDEIRLIYLGEAYLHQRAQSRGEDYDLRMNEYYELRNKKYSDEARSPNYRDLTQISLEILKSREYNLGNWQLNLNARITNFANNNIEVISALNSELDSQEYKFTEFKKNTPTQGGIKEKAERLFFEEKIQYLNARIVQLEKEGRQRLRTNDHSLNWLGTQPQLNLLYQELIKYKWVEETSFETFKYNFSGDISKGQITWATSKGCLILLMEALENNSDRQNSLIHALNLRLDNTTFFNLGKNLHKLYATHFLFKGENNYTDIAERGKKIASILSSAKDDLSHKGYSADTKTIKSIIGNICSENKK